MVIASEEANLFLSNYSRLLYTVHLLSGGGEVLEVIPMLSAARDAAVAEPFLFETAALELEAEDTPVPIEILEAVRSLKVRQWAYLRDTPEYSIFMDLNGRDAYAVRGLIQPISEIVKGAGKAVRIGLVRYKGTYICDGIISHLTRLNAKQQKAFAELFQSIKEAGRFHGG